MKFAHFSWENSGQNNGRTSPFGGKNSGQGLVLKQGFPVFAIMRVTPAKSRPDHHYLWFLSRRHLSSLPLWRHPWSTAVSPLHLHRIHQIRPPRMPRPMAAVLLNPKICCFFENLTINRFAFTALDKCSNEQQIFGLTAVWVTCHKVDYYAPHFETLQTVRNSWAFKLCHKYPIKIQSDRLIHRSLFLNLS